VFERWFIEKEEHPEERLNRSSGKEVSKFVLEGLTHWLLI
jgi:hypothetical protein